MASKKTVLITGCSEGGLGDVLAQEFHSRGYRVFATARNPNKMAHFHALGIETLVLDVLSQDSIKAAVEQVSKLTDKLDILVNNSGGGYSMPLIDAEISKMRDLFELNVISYMAVTQAFLPLIRSAGPGAVIANNTSIASMLTIPTGGTYSATKAAMAVLTDVLRLELEPFDIKVVDLRTGAVKSKFFENQGKNNQAEDGMKLPPGSLYEVGREALEKNLNGANVTSGAMDPVKWAKRVVGDLTKSSPPDRIYRGSTAWTAWFVKAFLPRVVIDSVLRSFSGMNEFSKKWKSQKKAQ